MQVVVLVEDKQSEVFFYRLLRRAGFRHYDIVVRTNYPKDGAGCGSQWVREQYAAEVSYYRQHAAGARRALMVHIDADNLAVDERLRQLATALASASVPARSTGEAIGIAVPKRATEAWIAFLDDQGADEQRDWPKLTKAGDCHPAADRLARLLKGQSPWPADAPDSLNRARPEFDRILP